MITKWVQFDPDGPYTFKPVVSAKQVTSKGLKGWFKGRDAGGHRGVYLIASGRKKLKPWYVGLATKQTFRQECTTPDKITKINLALTSIGRGEPVFLFLKLVSGRKKPTKLQARAIDELETELIRWCFGRNAELVNDRKKMPQVASYIPGALRSGPGKPSAAARSLRTLLGE